MKRKNCEEKCILTGTMVSWKCYSCRYHNQVWSKHHCNFNESHSDLHVETSRRKHRRASRRVSTRPNEPHVNLFRFIQARALSTLGLPPCQGYPFRPRLFRYRPSSADPIHRCFPMFHVGPFAFPSFLE